MTRHRSHTPVPSADAGLGLDAAGQPSARRAGSHPISDRFEHHRAHQREVICHHVRCREADLEIRDALARAN